jgi:hypothetical protein
MKNKMKRTRFLSAGLWAACICLIAGCGQANDNDPEQIVEDLGGINGKWEIKTPGSAYASFEFTKDGNYIVVENGRTSQSAKAKVAQALTVTGESFLGAGKVAKPLAAGEPNVHFGVYYMQDEHTIVLSGWGVLVIVSMSSSDLVFSFALTASPSQKVEYSAKKADNTVAASTHTDLLCRTWKLVKLMGVDITDMGDTYNLTVLFSRAGTYLVMQGNGTTTLSQWKWYDYPGADKETVFVYSHDSWANMGAAFITKLAKDSFEMGDSAGIVYELEADDTSFDHCGAAT